MKSLPCFIGLRVEQKQRQRLEELAAETGVGSLSGVLRLLIDSAEAQHVVEQARGEEGRSDGRVPA